MTALPRGRKSEDNDFDASGKARPPPEKDSPEKNPPSKSKKKKKKGDQKKRRSREQQQRHAVLVVLGDFGHSPRAQNHALSLVKRGHVVTVIAYANGSSVRKDWRKHKGKKMGVFESWKSPDGR